MAPGCQTRRVYIYWQLISADDNTYILSGPKGAKEEQFALTGSWW